MKFNLDDDSRMLWGNKHRGRKMSEVPAEYLLWILSEWRYIPRRLHLYIVENQNALILQAEEEKD